MNLTAYFDWVEIILKVKETKLKVKVNNFKENHFIEEMKKTGTSNHTYIFLRLVSCCNIDSLSV